MGKLRRVAMVASLAAIISACAPAKEEQATPEDNSYRARIERNYTQNCAFQTREQLESNLRERIFPEIRLLLDFYNERFGTDYSAKNIDLEFGTFDQRRPKFYYGEEDHKLHIDFFPSDQALDALEDFNLQSGQDYLEALCENRLGLWSNYQKQTTSLTAHEVAHWYHGEFMKRNGIELESTTYGTAEHLGVGLIVEGIATYMASLLDPSESLIGNRTIEGNLRHPTPFETIMAGGLWDPGVYAAGEVLVKPVLEADFQKGLRLLSVQPPTPNTTQDLYQYQADMLSQVNSP